jgi:branched-chain amino acid transport system substrate-binding protein
MVLQALEQVAIDQDGTLYIPRTALRDAVGATANFPGITGTLTCNADGDCQPSATIAVFQVKDGDLDTENPVFQTVGSLEG